jgi:hypothetical protein
MEKYIEIIKKALIFWWVAWIVMFWAVYASNIITSITSQTINSWDTISQSWYQDVNDKLSIVTVCNNWNVWKINNNWFICKKYIYSHRLNYSVIQKGKYIVIWNLTKTAYCTENWLWTSTSKYCNWSISQSRSTKYSFY